MIQTNWFQLTAQTAEVHDIQRYCHGVSEAVAQAIIELLYDSEFSHVELEQISRFTWQCLLDDAQAEVAANNLDSDQD